MKIDVEYTSASGDCGVRALGSHKPVGQVGPRAAFTDQNPCRRLNGSGQHFHDIKSFKSKRRLNRCVHLLVRSAFWWDSVDGQQHFMLTLGAPVSLIPNYRTIWPQTDKTYKNNLFNSCTKTIQDFIQRIFTDIGNHRFHGDVPRPVPDLKQLELQLRGVNSMPPGPAL